MNTKTLESLTHSFNEFAGEHQINNYLSAHIEQIYYALHEILEHMGYQVLSRDAFDELYNIHMEESGQESSKNLKMLQFVLQLTDAKVTQDSISLYKLKCDDHWKLYDLLNKKCDFRLNCDTVVCNKSRLLSLFLENNIITKSH